LKYLKIYKDNISDGPGVRVSVYFAGCLPNKCKEGNCPGCHNPEAQNFNAGTLYTKETEQEILEAASKSFIAGLSIVGGEPYDQDEYQLIELVKKFKAQNPEKNVWIYTGYEFNQIKNRELTKYVDVAVVGPFILAERDISDDNRWRGSRNQRVIDVPKSLKTGKINMLEGIPNNEKLED